MYWHKRFTKQWACAILGAVMLFAGCQRTEEAPRPEFPLSQETLAAALDETGLSWTIRQADERTDGTDQTVVYTLNRPESGVDYNTAFVNGYHSSAYGRSLELIFHVPQDKQWWVERKEPRWEDFQQAMALAARLYGGFADPEELYRACSAVELPRDVRVLWEGALTGGYCRVTASAPLKSWASSKGYSVTVRVYESEEAYGASLRHAEKAREEMNANDQK